jgi:hypothetical protein
MAMRRAPRPSGGSSAAAAAFGSDDDDDDTRRPKLKLPLPSASAAGGGGTSSSHTKTGASNHTNTIVTAALRIQRAHNATRAFRFLSIRLRSITPQCRRLLACNSIAARCISVCANTHSRAHDVSAVRCASHLHPHCVFCASMLV